MKITALIPARSGSERIQNKNIKILNKHPLIAYSIASALKSSLFDRVIVATDNKKYQEIAVYYGAEVPKLRPDNISSSESPDIEWLLWAIKEFKIPTENHSIALLRPTSPLRSSDELIKAWKHFLQNTHCDSLRAVSITNDHPGKMWVLKEQLMYPLLPYELDKVPWHSNQTKKLPKIYVQNASLEIIKVESILKHSSISGDVILPFISHGLNGYDINNIEDFEFLEFLISKNENLLPEINKNPFSISS